MRGDSQAGLQLGLPLRDRRHELRIGGHRDGLLQRFEVLGGYQRSDGLGWTSGIEHVDQSRQLVQVAVRAPVCPLRTIEQAFGDAARALRGVVP